MYNEFASRQASKLPGLTRSGSIFLALALLITLPAFAQGEGSPDLIITDGPFLSAPNVGIEETVSITYRIQNIGDAISETPFREAIYLATEPTFGPSAVFLRDSFEHNIPINPGSKTGVHSRELTIPFGTELGDYYIVVVADGLTNAVAESDETNNSAAVPVTVGPGAGPDLVIDGGSVELSTSSAIVGDTITATFRIRNQGSETSDIPFRDAIYLSLDPFLDAGDRFIRDSFEHNIPIAPGGLTSVHARELTIPLDVPPATYYVLVEADGLANVIAESNEANNVAASAQIAIGGGKDLVVEPGFGLSATSVAVEGEISVTYQLRNIGDAPVTAFFRDALMLSTDATLDGSDVFLRDSFEHNLGVQPGSRTSLHTRELVIPFGTAPGDYYILIVADGLDNVVAESNESNNVAALAVTVTEGSTQPDMVVWNGDVEISGYRVPRGGTFSVTYRLKNIGDATAAVDYRDNIYYSTDQNLDAGDLLARKSFLHNIPTPPGYRTSVHTREIIVPEDLETGDYYLIVEADGDNLLEESNEANNVAVSRQKIWVGSPGKDLIVDPGYALSSGTASVEGQVSAIYKLRNIGIEAVTTSFRDALYLSTDTALDGADVFLRDSFEHNIDIQPGFRTSLHTRELEIPFGTEPGNYYVLIVADGLENLVAESDEANNVVALPLQVTLSEGEPDLVVFENDVALSATSTSAGGSIDVTYRLQNIGDVTSVRPFRDRITLSTDAVESPDDIFLRDSFEHNIPVPPGFRTSVHTRTLEIPESVTPGEYYILVKADGLSNQVAESNESNNVAATDLVTVWAAGKDLTPRELNLSSPSVAISHSVVIDYRIVNLGVDTVTEDWKEVICLSKDDILDGGDLFLRNSIRHSNDLPGFGSRRFSEREVVIPDEHLEPGSYYIIVFTDDELIVEESNEQNNTAAIPIEITERTGEPDLIVENPALAAFTVGAGLSVDVTWTLVNQGDAATLMPFRDTVWLSTDATLDEADVFLRNSVHHELPIPGDGGTFDVRRGVVIPMDTDPGDYYILVEADGDRMLDESDETNNVSATPIHVVTATGDFDMIIERLKLSKDYAYPGEMIDVSYGVVNLGTKAIEASWKDGIYLSTDTALDAGDAFLDTSHRHTFNLLELAGASHSHTEDVFIPASTEPGQYYILVRGDERLEIDESDETNNVSATPITIWALGQDLVVSALSTSAPSVPAGEAITVDHTVMNQGVEDVTTPWWDGIYLSDDEILDEDDRLLRFTHRHTVDLPAYGGTHGHGRDVAIPSDVAAGDYFLIVHADGQLSIEESYEDNNTATIALSVEANLGLADLVVDELKLSRSMVFVTGSVVVRYFSVNQGYVDVTMDHWDSIYLSTDETLDDGDVLLRHSTLETADIDGLGGRRATSREVAIPGSTAAGEYFILVEVDGLTLVEENDETNNVASAPILVKVGDGKADLVIDDVLTDAHGTAGEALTVSYNSVNIGTADVEMGHHDGFYLSSDDQLDAKDVKLALSDLYTGDIAEGAFDPRVQQAVIPAGTEPGDYFLLVMADDVDTEVEVPVGDGNLVEELDETNNVTAVPLTVWAGGKDLVLRDVTLSDTVVCEKDWLAVTFTTVNQGVEPTVLPFQDGIYLSWDGWVDMTDIFLELSHPHAQGIPGFGGSFTQTRYVVVPWDIEPGEYYIALQTDDTFLVDESNEDNNHAAAKITVEACFDDPLPPSPPPPPADDEQCVARADKDTTVFTGGAGHALWLPGIGEDFVFDPSPGSFVEHGDGTATLSGTLSRKSRPNQGFEMVAALEGFTEETPAGSPKKELKSSAYVGNGGPIDPSTWTFYTSWTGTLTGTGDFAGAVLTLESTGSALQIGAGANGKNTNNGMSSWLTWTVVSQPDSGATLRSNRRGDINMDIVDCPAPPSPPTIEVGDFRTQTQGGWGTACRGNNPGCYRDANFAGCFTNGLVTGLAGFDTAAFTGSSAVQAFLPEGGPAGALGESLVDPLSSNAGVLLSQVTALTLSVGFDLCDANFGASDTSLRDLVVCEISPACELGGATVGELLDIANAVLAGENAPVDASTINACVSSVNESFVDGTQVSGFLCLP